MARTIGVKLSLKDKFSSPAKKATKSVKQMQREVKHAQNQVKQFGRSATKSFNDVAKKAGKMAATTGKVLAGVSIGAGAVGFKEAFDMEGYKTQLITATKDTKKASKLMVSSVKFANKTPFETGSVIEATAKMEMYSISSKKWLKDIADMAGATNKDIIQATEAMADASLGEFERLKEFGIRKDDIMLASAKKYGKGVVFDSKGSMLDQAKMMTVLQEIMQKKYKGGADKLSKTSKGLWSTITGVTKSSLAKIVGMQEDGTIKQGSLYAKLKEKMKVVADTLTKWQSDGTIDKIRIKVENTVSKVFKNVKKIVDWIVKNKEKIKTVGVMIFSLFAAGKIIKIAKAIGTVIKVVKCLGMLKTFSLLINPWMLLIAGIITGAYLIYKNWDKIKAKAIELWNNLKQTFNGIKESIVNSITNMITAVKEKINNIIANIKEIIANAIEGFKSRFPALYEYISEQIGYFKGFLQGIIDFITGVFAGDWEKAWQGLKDAAINLVKGMFNSVTEVFDRIKKTVSNLWDKITGKGKKKIQIEADITKTYSSTNKMKKYARGGIAKKPSIFGDAGPEIAIPLRKTQRSKDLLAQANKLIGHNSTENSIKINNNSMQTQKNIGGTKIQKDAPNMIFKIYGNVYGEEDFINKVGKAIFNKTQNQLENMA